MSNEQIVTIGPVTMTKQSFDFGFIAFTVIAGFALFAIVTIIAFYAYNSSKPAPPPPPLDVSNIDPTLYLNIGASVSAVAPIKYKIDDGSLLTNELSCLSSPNTKWVDGKCICNDGFFGETCSQEKYNSNYFAIGNPTPDSIKITILDSVSSNKYDCSLKCNDSDNCIGFIHEKGELCILLKDDVTVNPNRSIPYSIQENASLYLKSGEKLHFEERIFIARIKENVPPRFWLTKEQYHYRQLSPNEITIIDFAPSFSKIYGDYTGIYCTHEFNQDDISILLDRGRTNECYIHKLGERLDLPKDWSYKKLFVSYITC